MKMDRYLDATRGPGTPSSHSSTSPFFGTPAAVLVDDDSTDLPASESTATDPRSTPCAGYEAATFNIDWNQIWHGNKRLSGCYYAPRHKRVLGSKVKVSWIWQHGAKLIHEDKNYWLCRLCHTTKRYWDAMYSAASTQHCHNHMKDAHGLIDPSQAAKQTRSRGHDPFRVAAEAAALRAAANGTPDPEPVPPYDDTEYKERFISWVVGDDITYRQAISPRLQWLLLHGGPQVEDTVPKSHNTVSAWIIESFHQSRKQVKDLLATSRSRINLSFDLWTSSNGLSLVGVVAHFVDYQGHLRTALLGLPRLLGSHSGENMANCIRAVIDEYEVGPNLGCFMMDNAGDNDTCIMELKRYFPTIDEKEHRLRCAGHIFNLVTKAILFGKGVSKWQRKLLGASDDESFRLWREKGPIGRLHNFVKFIGRSDQRRTEFAALQVAQAAAKGEKIFIYQLISDGGVRWNSTYAMIKRGLKLRDAIDLYYKRYKGPSSSTEYDISQDELSPEDWAILQRFCNLLRPFKEMTKRIEGNANKAGYEGSQGAVWEVLESMDFLSSKLEALAASVKHEPADYFTVGIETGWSKLQKYYTLTDQSAIYRAAIVLHPASKEFYFEEKWAKHPNWIRGMRTAVRGLYQKYVDADGAASRQADEETEEEEASSEVVTEFESFRRISDKFKPKKKPRLQNEYDRYTEDFPDQKDKLVDNPLAWWNREAWKYPILSKMAYDLFSIPGMSSECERVFSQAKKLVTDERNRLGPATIEADECLKNWINSGLLEA
jgi:hypothetical protein